MSAARLIPVLKVGHIPSETGRQTDDVNGNKLRLTEVAGFFKELLVCFCLDK